MISTELAQKIVDVVIPLIHCNVNIMNEQGIIIGSGDKQRIGQVHPIAKQVIETPNLSRDFSLIVNNNQIDNENMLPGVNLPIFFNNRVIGVVGVTGEPNRIIQQTKLIQHMLSIIMARPKNMQLTNAIKKLSIKRPINTSCQITWQGH